MPADSTHSVPRDPLRGLPLLGLVGPTAVGKTAVALRVAERLGAEVVSVDSMLVYRGLDVGTAKPGPEDRARVRHHLLDRADPSERYDVTRYLADVAEACEDLVRRGARGLFVGGTGFYLKALTHGVFDGPPADPGLRAALRERARSEGPERLHAELARVDPASAERLHANDVRRVVRALEVHASTGRPLSAWQREWRAAEGAPLPGRRRRLVGLDVDPAELDVRIRSRTRQMLDAGWVEEALRVRASTGFGPTASQALGYAEVLQYADGELDREALEERVALRTRQFARRQRTWFRKFPDIRWVPGPAGPDEVEEAADRVVEALGTD